MTIVLYLDTDDGDHHHGGDDDHEGLNDLGDAHVDLDGVVPSPSRCCAHSVHHL